MSSPNLRLLLFICLILQPPLDHVVKFLEIGIIFVGPVFLHCF